MKFGSVCSGIEAASVAWGPLGWSAAWLAEIESFPSAVLAHHYSDVPNHGDMTTLPDRISSGEVEAPDLFCGGTPCQAFSVAGLRKSLDDARGNLSLVFCEIANAIDTTRHANNHPPAIIFWENVPGVLNTSDNAFGCFLAGLAGEDDPLIPPGDKWSNAGCVFGPKRAVAWRILDAQYFGVAQRRRRVFVVASARNDFDPAAVLFEFDSLRRDTPPGREAGKVAAASAGAGAPFGGMSPVAGTLTANTGGMTRPAGNANQLDFCVPVTQFGDTAGTLTARHDSSPCADRSMNVVAQPMPINTMIALRHEALGERTGFGIGDAGDPSFTLTKGHSHAVAQPIAFPANLSATQCASTEDLAPAMGAKNPTAVAFQERGRSDGRSLEIGGNVSYSLTAPNGGGRAQERNILTPAMQVRRLTPIECERLQGFPDNYTAIPWRKKPASECPDGPRYKALGNSWAVPVVRWIGKRIQSQLS